MKKLSFDTLNGKDVIISNGRHNRPKDKVRELINNEEYDKNCPFCRGNEKNISEETCVINRGNDWIVKSVKNKYPIIDENSLNEISGEHEVIIDTYKHNSNFFNMNEEEFYYLLLMYKRRYKYLKENKNTKYICLFKNHLRNAGASLMHSHSQILSLPFIPPDLKEEYRICEEFYEKKGINMYRHIIEEEVKYEKRLVYNDEDFLIFIPKVCRFTGDTVIIFKENIYFDDVDNNKLKKLSLLIKKIFNKIYNENGNCPFNLYIHCHPVNEEKDYKEIYNVNIHIIPRKFNFGGFELSTGMYISSIESEEIAKKLKFD